jgi:hypothetical protein
MYEETCKRCGRTCYTPKELDKHNCVDVKAELDAEIALADWDGRLSGQLHPVFDGIFELWRTLP